MSLEQRVRALASTFLGEADERDAVISAAVSPPVQRFDYSDVVGLPGQSAAEHEKWMAAWKKMDLSHVFGFPMWEEEVFTLLQASFTDLLSIFTYYAYAGDAAASSSRSGKAKGGWSADTMQQSELVDLALDTGLATDAFPMTRVISLFEAENKRSGAGDADLELYEFLPSSRLRRSSPTRRAPRASRCPPRSSGSSRPPLAHRAPRRAAAARRAPRRTSRPPRLKVHGPREGLLRRGRRALRGPHGRA